MICTNIKEKIGRMLLIGFKGVTLQPEDAIVKAILARQIGGVVLFAANIHSPEQLKQLTDQVRYYAKQAGLDSFLIGIDYEGGTVERLNEKLGFPKALSAKEVGALGVKEAEQHAEQMAHTLVHAGINLNFAPVLDVDTNQNNPIIGKRARSFSSDPKKVADYAAIFSKAYQQHGIACVYKHFPGHGSSTGDTHLGLVDVSNTWHQDELHPYKALLSSGGVAMVMTAHVIHFGLDKAGYPASISAEITTGLLRDKLKYQGVVITDDMQMKAIVDHYGLPEAVTLAVNAGADMMIFGNQLSLTLQQPEEIIDIICSGITSGKIAASRIDESYQRIIANVECVQSVQLDR